MRKLLGLALLIVVTTPDLYSAPRRRSAAHRPNHTLYRGDAARSGASSQTGPRYLDSIRWERMLQGPVRGLVFDRDTLYAGALGGVSALDARTSIDRWVFAMPGVQFSPVAVSAGEVYVAGGSVFYALDRDTGARLWSIDAGSAIDQSSPLLVNGMACFGSAAGTVHAIDLAARAEAWRRNVGSPVRTHLVAGQDRLIVVADGALHTLSMADGTVHWSRAGQWSAAASDGVRIFAGAAGNEFLALDLLTGDTLWAQDDVDSAISGWNAPVIAGAIVTAGNRAGRVFGFDRVTGTRRWTVDTGQPAPSDAILAADGRLYFGMGAPERASVQELTDLWIVDAASGAEQSRAFVDGHVPGGVAIGGGAVFVHTADDHLLAITD